MLSFCTGTKHISYIKGTEIIWGFVYFSRNGLDAREGEGGNTGSIQEYVIATSAVIEYKAQGTFLYPFHFACIYFPTEVPHYRAVVEVGDDKGFENG